ncbi:MAG: DUF503 domain-containing protein [Dehalococcoidia bacterium]|nr:DUF503 domain-containing protein [Dehalococcoidia bacterium]
MNVGVCKLKLHIPESQSLKDKRSVVKSITTRLQKQFNISIAEVDDHALWQIATIGIACVSNQNFRVDEVINSVINAIERDYPTVEIIEKETDTFC